MQGLAKNVTVIPARKRAGNKKKKASEATQGQTSFFDEEVSGQLKSEVSLTEEDDDDELELTE